MATPMHSLNRSVSPPPKKRKKSLDNHNSRINVESTEPCLAAIEAGEAKIKDHLDYFAKIFWAVIRPSRQPTTRLRIDDFVQLYKNNDHDRGRHFTIHQHNHPVAGVHYDLRLQFSRTSTCSWAVPYGLPGNPNSRRRNRMAIETRVHNLWNNLIESASHATGSLLIWDIGEYEVLPRKAVPDMTDDETTDERSETSNRGTGFKSESDKLFNAFRERYIRLRLHGTRLPTNYTITLRLPSNNNAVRSSPTRPVSKRHRRGQHSSVQRRQTVADSEDTGPDVDSAPSPTAVARRQDHMAKQASVADDTGVDDEVALASEDEGTEAETIRANNAYTGAYNTIGSIHQRHWFLSLDKHSSGFARQDGRWVRKGGDGFDPFYVQGPDVEKSVVTGRLSAEVMADEGVQGFQARRMWRPIID